VKVVIAGGSGLIGRHLVDALTALGNECVVLSRDARKRVPGARMVSWDGRLVGEWRDELAGTGAVINLCGESVGRWPWTGRVRQRLRHSRLAPTAALVEAIRQLPPADRPRVLVSASGTDTYEGRDRDPATEQTPPGEGFLSRLCVEWESAAIPAARLGVRVAILRLALVVAPGAPSLERLALPVRWHVGGPIGSGRQWISWVDIADVVGLTQRVLEDEALAGALNVAAPEPVPAGRVHRHSRWDSRPPSPGEDAGLGGAARPRRTGDPGPGQPARLACASAGGGYRFCEPDLEASLRGAFAEVGARSRKSPTE
jgi:uncharacterized protein (TIGR01777 family)